MKNISPVSTAVCLILTRKSLIASASAIETVGSQKETFDETSTHRRLGDVCDAVRRSWNERVGPVRPEAETISHGAVTLGVLNPRRSAQGLARALGKELGDVEAV